MYVSSIPRIRLARPTQDLDAARHFYTRGLGLDVLGSFVDHAGFDGVILGRAEWPYHLEFTRRPHDPVAPRPTEEDLLVFYLPERTEWELAARRACEHGGRVVPPSNPYWAERGITILDPDGYRIVFENATWP